MVVLSLSVDAGFIAHPTEGTMQTMYGHDSQPSLVTAVFKDTSLSFELPPGATMEQLADYLADLGEVHGGKPIAIDVQLVC
jgi:hypothetical protein